MSINSCRPLTQATNRSCVMPSNVSNIKACKVCEEGVVEDEYHMFFICLVHCVIHENYDAILRGGDDLSGHTEEIELICVCFIHTYRLCAY